MPPSGHRIARIDREVHDRVLQILRIAPDLERAVGQRELDRDAEADREPQQGLQIAQQRIDVDAGLHGGPRPAIGHQALGQRRRAVDRAQTVRRERLQFRDPARIDPAIDHVQHARDALQQIAEIMDDGGSHQADRRQAAIAIVLRGRRRRFAVHILRRLVRCIMIAPSRPRPSRTSPDTPSLCASISKARHNRACAATVSLIRWD
ncbi:MAG: hypothetical protein WDM81_06400 [Rhizomicrobium sp.]